MSRSAHFFSSTKSHMSAHSFCGVPSFLDGLSEADRFIRVVECVRELKMHSILVPELREISGRLYI